MKPLDHSTPPHWGHAAVYAVGICPSPPGHVITRRGTFQRASNATALSLHLLCLPHRQAQNPRLETSWREQHVEDHYTELVPYKFLCDLTVVGEKKPACLLFKDPFLLLHFSKSLHQLFVVLLEVEKTTFIVRRLGSTTNTKWSHLLNPPPSILWMHTHVHYATFILLSFFLLSFISTPSNVLT